MSAKAKTWAELTADINETARKWERRITITNTLPPRKRNQVTWQSEEERAIEVTFPWHGFGATPVGTVRIVMKREMSARENLAKVAVALETIRLNEVRDVHQIMIRLYRQMYPLDAATPPPRPQEPPRVPSHYALLHVSPDAPLAVCEATYRTLARTAHPDQGGSTETMQRLNSAIELIRKEKA